MRPTMEEANTVHLEVLEELQDCYAASVMLGTREGERRRERKEGAKDRANQSDLG